MSYWRKLAFHCGLTVSGAFLCFLISACGGGHVSIHTAWTNDGLVPPGQMIEKLERSAPDVIEAHFKELASSKGDVFDWTGFWTLLSQRPFRSELVRDHRDSLLSLHAKSCPSYSAFSRFLLSVDDGFEYALTDKRKCPGPLPAEIAIDIFTTLSKKTKSEKVPKHGLDSLYRFLTAEFSKNRSKAWLEALRDPRNEITLREAAERTIAKNDFSGFLEFMLDFADASGSAPLPDLAQKEFFTNAAIVKKFFSEKGTEESLRIYSQLAQVNRADVPSSFRLEQVEDLVRQVVFSPMPMDERKAMNSILHYGKAKDLILTLGKSWTLKEKLRLVERLQSGLENTLAQLSTLRREKLFQEARQTLKLSPLIVDLAWFSVRFLHSKHPLLTSLRQQLSEPAILKDSSNQVMLSRVQVYLENDTKNRVAKMAQFCHELESNGITKEEISADFLKDELRRGLPAGCYQVDNREARERWIDVNATEYLVASSNSLVEVLDSSLRLKAPYVEMGMVLLKKTYHKEPVPVKAAPPEDNAVIFPLLLGINVDREGLGFVKGAHFFVTHFVYKNADAGKPNPVRASAGFRGPRMRIVASKPVRRFAFVSLGGPGQVGAPKSPGGQGDSSIVDYEKMSDWLMLQAERTDRSEKIAGPIRAYEKVSLRQLEKLLVAAKRNEKDEAILYVLPDYYHQLDERQKAKIQKTCEILMKKFELTQGEMDRCLKEKLGPLAMAQLRAHISDAKEDGALDTKSPFPKLDTSIRYELPSGAEGPQNYSGVDGRPGVLRIKRSGANDLESISQEGEP